MKLPFKIVMINVGLALVFGLIFSALTESVVEGFGLVFLIGGSITIVIGLLAFLATDKRYAQGFLMSGGILLLLGFVTCGSLFSHGLGHM